MATEEYGVKIYIVPSRQIVEFPKYIADHIVKHLAAKIATENPITMESKGIRLHYEIRLQQALDKIYVK